MYVLIHPVYLDWYFYGGNTHKITFIDLIISIVNHLGILLTLSALFHDNIVMVSKLTPNNIAILLNHNNLESTTPICVLANAHKPLHNHYDKNWFT